MRYRVNITKVFHLKKIRSVVAMIFLKTIYIHVYEDNKIRPDGESSVGTCRISKNKRYCDVPVPRRPVLASLRATLDTYLPHLPLSRLLSGAVVVNNVWGIPVQLATALVLLQQQLGYSAFTGLFVMLAFAPLHYAIIR